MPLGVQKPIRNKDFISFFVPTRGRADSVKRQLDSFAETVARPELFDVWIYVDEDDAPTLDVVNEAGHYPFAVHAVCGPATDTNGEMYNTLRDRCTSDPGLYLIGNDKIAFHTQGWDEIARATFDRFSDRIVFAFPQDQVNRDQFAPFFMLSAEWANTLGRLFTEYFPFWYDDTWLNALGHMIGRFVPMPIELELHVGPTQRMQNLLFWDRFYHCMLDVRIEEANMLRRAIFGADEAGYQESLKAAQPTIEGYRAMAVPTKERNTQMIVLERKHAVALKRSHPRQPVGSTYRTVESRAAAELMKRLIPTGNQGNGDMLSMIIDALLHSSEAGEDLIRRVEAALAANDGQAATSYLQLMQERFPNFPETYQLWADKWTAEGKYSETEELLGHVLSVFPAQPGLLKRSGVVQYLKGDLAAAEASFRRVLDAAPEDTDVLVSLGHLAMAGDRLEEALATFQAAAEGNPGDVDAWIGIALAAQTLQRPADREVAVARVQALDPSHPSLAGQLR